MPTAALIVVALVSIAAMAVAVWLWHAPEPSDEPDRRREQAR